MPRATEDRVHVGSMVKKELCDAFHLPKNTVEFTLHACVDAITTVRVKHYPTPESVETLMSSFVLVPRAKFELLPVALRDELTP